MSSNAYIDQWYAARARSHYQQAVHAIRYLRTNGNTVMGHDLFLKKTAHIPVFIMQAAWDSMKALPH